MQTTRDDQQLTISAFLKRQSLLLRAMTDISKKGFIADALLRGGYSADGGVVPYTRSETIYSDRDPQFIEELAEYPISPIAPLTQLVEVAKKYGLKSYLSEEAVRRSQLPELQRALTKLSNTIIRYVDSLFLTKLAGDAAINTQAASATWTTSATTITADIENARSLIRLQYEGYNPDTLVIHPSKIPALVANTNLQGYFVGTKAPDNPVFTGQLPDMWGLQVMYTPNLPASNYALLLERQTIGGIADEVPMQVKALPFDEDHDAHWLKGRRVVATFLQEPKAVTKITGI